MIFFVNFKKLDFLRTTLKTSFFPVIRYKKQIKEYTVLYLYIPQ